MTLIYKTLFYEINIKIMPSIKTYSSLNVYWGLFEPKLNYDFFWYKKTLTTSKWTSGNT